MADFRRDGIGMTSARTRERLVQRLRDNGIRNVAAQLREMDPQSRCTLVALTGYGQQKDKERAQGCGFQHHLLKPVDFGALREILVEVRKKVE